MKNTLYLRLSGIFFVLLLLVGLVYTGITTYTARQYYMETTQRLNSNVAEHMLLEVKPFVNGEVNKEALHVIMHSMMAVNPSLEVYLVDKEGTILEYVVLDETVKLSRISLEPVKEFLKDPGGSLIYGDDPGNPGSSSIFSATRVFEDGELMGYVYMVLVSDRMSSISSTLLGSYALKLGSTLLIIALIFALIIGLTLIWLLTRNLRGIIQIFKKFEEGDLRARIPEKKARGELKILARNFNSMADRILQNIEDLKSVDSLRRELIANVSHDLRNPLAVIHGYIETLIIKEGDVSTEERKKYLEIVLKTSEKLKKLVGDLFELSKLESRQMEINKEDFNINELIGDLVSSVELMAKEKNIEINTQLENRKPHVSADVGLINRVLQNLMDNAIKYTPKNGKIDVILREEDSRLEVSVQNTGEGIPEEEISKIFDRYYMARKEKDKNSSTGLGLAISKRIVELHKSKLSVEPVGPDTVRFHFHLPLAS